MILKIIYWHENDILKKKMSNTCDWKKWIVVFLFYFFFMLTSNLLKHSENDDVFYKV